jgi:peptide deformylase
MAILTILQFPDARLRVKAEPVTEFDADLQHYIDDLIETMYHDEGVGLASTQVGIAKQVIVIDVSEEYNQPIAMVNPQILMAEGTQKSKEGCLSVPYCYAEVERPAYIKVQGQDAKGQTFVLEGTELLAACLHHEIDHLLGKLFIDYLSPLKRQMYERKLRKAKMRV